MKKLVLIIAVCLFSMTALAQPACYHRLYHTYKGEEGVVAFRVPGVLIKLAGCFADLDHEEKALLRSLKSVSILTIEDDHHYPGLNFAEEMGKGMEKGNYKLLLKVHEDGEDVMIAAREKNGRISDLIVVVGGEENTMVHVKGRMKSDLLRELANVSGIEVLKVTAEI